MKIEDFERQKLLYFHIRKFQIVKLIQRDLNNVEKDVKYSVRIKYDICWMEVFWNLIPILVSLNMYRPGLSLALKRKRL